ncbi:Adenylate cyclase 10 [Balamuthia mandrillaris]
MYAFQSSIKSKKKGEKKRSAGGSRRESKSKEKNVTASSSSDASSSSSSHPFVQPIVGLHTLPPYDNSTPSSIRSPSSASSRSPCSSPGSRSPSFSSSSPRLPLSAFALSATTSTSELAHHAEEGDSINNTSSQLLSLSSYSSTSASPYSSGPPSPLSSSSRSSSCSSLSTEEVFITPPNEHSASGATVLTAKQAAKEEKRRLKEESTKQAAKEERRRLKQETLQRQKEEKRQHRMEADKQKELRREEKRILQMQKEQALEYRKEEKKHQKAERELLRQQLKEHKKESGSHHKTASMENILASSYPEGTQMEHMSKKWKKDQKKELALLKSLQKKEKKEGRWQNSLDSGSGSPLSSERSGEGGGSGRPSIGAMPKEDPSKSAATGSNKDLVTMLATFLCRAIINRFLRDPTPLTSFETSQFTSTILFIDISGFTAMTEKLTAYGQDKGSEQVVRHLNSYFSSLVQMVQLYGGDVITFAGDAVICMFGDAKEENNDYQHRLRSSCLHATACALRIQQDLPNHTIGDAASPCTSDCPQGTCTPCTWAE